MIEVGQLQREIACAETISWPKWVEGFLLKNDNNYRGVTVTDKSGGHSDHKLGGTAHQRPIGIGQ